MDTRKRPTLEALMQTVNCPAYPARWAEIYCAVMADFEQHGCPLTDPAYYDELHNTYGVLVRHLDLYKEAAAAVGRRDDLSRLLALLTASLTDAENTKADLKAFTPPQNADGTPDLAVDMLTGLAICAQIPFQYQLLKARGLPDDVILSAMRLPEHGVEEYRKRHNGAPGYHLLAWFQLAINGRLFRIHRLEIELFANFRARAQIFANAAGETVALAHDIVLHRSGLALGSRGCEDTEGSFSAAVTETDTAWIGLPYDEAGRVTKATVSLAKREWRKVLEYGDPVVSLHIPPDGRLDDAAVDETLAMTRVFIRTYFPDFAPKAFSCHSWLLAPQLEQLLGADANIVRFGRRFRRLTIKSTGNDVFNFVFLKPDSRVDIAALPEDTRLTRALKAHYLAGNCIHEPYGYFF